MLRPIWVTQIVVVHRGLSGQSHTRCVVNTHPKNRVKITASINHILPDMFRAATVSGFVERRLLPYRLPQTKPCKTHFVNPDKTRVFGPKARHFVLLDSRIRRAARHTASFRKVVHSVVVRMGHCRDQGSRRIDLPGGGSGGRPSDRHRPNIAGGVLRRPLPARHRRSDGRVRGAGRAVAGRRKRRRQRDRRQAI